MEKTK